LAVERLVSTTVLPATQLLRTQAVEAAVLSATRRTETVPVVPVVQASAS
jgi:hypothetical protein